MNTTTIRNRSNTSSDAAPAEAVWRAAVRGDGEARRELLARLTVSPAKASRLPTRRPRRRISLAAFFPG